jgi:aminotransferase EvaB
MQKATISGMKVPYGYLPQEYVHNRVDIDEVLYKIRQCIQLGDFTLGDPVGEFEEAFAKAAGYPYAVAVNSGTDALFLAMKSKGVGPGDCVVTVPNTFVATLGAIIATGADPVLVDVGADYLMSQFELAGAATVLDKNFDKICYLPVELTGRPVRDIHPNRDLGTDDPVFRRHVVDSAQSIGSVTPAEKHTATFSLHPLKNVHVWGDGGVICTTNKVEAANVRSLRNHGLEGRDGVSQPGYNSRLDTIQAIVGLYSLSHLDWVTERRNHNARLYDQGFAGCEYLVIPPRDPDIKEAFHTYVIQASQLSRDVLVRRLKMQGIEAKVHYPTPLHLQPAFRYLGYEPGAFPVAEAQANKIISLPVHEYLTDGQIEYVIAQVTDFFAST